MATFLYRLGRMAYRRRWMFVSAWAVVLLAIGLSAGAFMGTLTNSFSIPGTETQRALDKLKAEMPEFAGGTGSIVYRTADGSEFTAQEEKSIQAALATLVKLDDVQDATDPFKLQSDLDSAQEKVADARQQLDDGKKQLADGKKKLADGKKQLADGRKEVADGKKQLTEGQAKIDDGKKQLAAAKAELADGRRQLAGPQAQLAEGRQQLAAGKEELATAQQQYEAGAADIANGRQQVAKAKKELAARETRITDGQEQHDAGLAQLLGGASRGQFLANLDAKETATKADESLTDAERQEELAKIEQARNSLATLDASQQELDAGAAQLKQGRVQLTAQEKELDAGAQQLPAAKKKLDAGWAEIAANQRKLDAGAAELAAGQAEVRDGEQQIAANEAKLKAGQQEIDANRAKLAEAEATLDREEKKLPDAERKLTEAEQKLEDGNSELALGVRRADSTEGMRFVSENGTTAAVNVTFVGSADALSTATRDEIKEIASAPEAEGVEVFFSKEIVTDLSAIFGIAEIIGLAVAAVVLLVMLGTLVAAGLPLLMAVLGVGAGVGGTLALSSVFEMASITPALALMLGLAVGIDYSLFIVHRHRRQLLDGMDIEESLGRANGTSGNAVVFAGLTVVIALAALAVPGLPFLTVLGLSAAFTVAMAVLLALTLTPALLGIIGSRLISKRAWAKAEAARAGGSASPAHSNDSGARGWGAAVTRRPLISAVVGILVLGIVALPALQLRTALPDGGAEPVDSSAYQAYNHISDAFGGGYNGPILVLADLPDGLDAEAAGSKTLDIADDLRGIDGVVAAVPVGTNEAHTLGVLQVIPQEGPASQATETVVENIRSAAAGIEAETGSHIALTGQVTAQIDVSEKLSEVLPLYLGIVVGLSLILLLLVFRSIVVPLLATAGFLLSLTAAFGATVAVYQWGWLSGVFGVETPGPIMSFLPILLTGILFGLAMDYQVFLVSGMRESFAHGEDPREAVRSGFAHSAPVVTAAALIMTSVFAGFIFSHLTMIRAIGFALAFGVLVDAFIVRMTITPAIMHLLGKHAWYIPRWLDRILPDVDVEGAKLNALADSDRTTGTDTATDTDTDTDTARLAYAGPGDGGPDDDRGPDDDGGPDGRNGKTTVDA